MVTRKFLIYASLYSTFLFCTGCATQAETDAKMNRWLGSDISSLIATWGPPARVDTLPNGSKMYSFIKDGSYTVPGYVTPTSRDPVTTTITRYGNTAYATSSGGTVRGGDVVAAQRIDRMCTVSFTTALYSARVERWSYNGVCRGAL